MKKIMILVLSMIIMILFISCKDSKGKNISENNGDKDIPEILISSGGNVINYKSYEVNENKNLNNFFEKFSEMNSEIILVDQSEKIDFDFKNILPKKMTLYDYYIDSNGDNKFEKEEIRKDLKKGKDKFKYSFTLGSNSSEILESNLEGYKYRGFRLICELNNNKYQYIFVVKTTRMK